MNWPTVRTGIKFKVDGRDAEIVDCLDEPNNGLVIVEVAPGHRFTMPAGFVQAQLERENIRPNSREPKQLVAIESPFAGDTGLNIKYAIACARNILSLGHLPFAGHLLYPLILKDHDSEQRKLGMKAGQLIADKCAVRWFFVDYGYSSGMKAARTHAEKIGQAYYEVSLGQTWRSLIADIPKITMDATFYALTHGGV